MNSQFHDSGSQSNCRFADWHFTVRFVAQYLHDSRALSGVGKYGVNSKHPMAAWERKKYGAGGPPNTNEDEKYMGLWHFDDLPSFEDAT